jgi:hypothetical protein
MTRSARTLTTVSVIAALVLTAEAEWTLAQAVGWSVWVAWAWPASLDTYVLASLRAGRDRGWALGLMSLSVSGAHALPILWPSLAPWWVAGGLSVIPPLVAWRVHELTRGHGPVAHQADQLTPVTPGVVHPVTLDQAMTPVTLDQLDHVTPDDPPVMTQVTLDQLDHVTPDDPPVMTPRRATVTHGTNGDRVAWAMGQPGVAPTRAIQDRFGVSASTAKRVRREALALDQDVTP